MDKVKVLLALIVVAAIAGLAVWTVGGRKKKVTVWAVTMVQLAETGELQDKIEAALKKTCGNREIAFERKSAMGDEETLKQILARAEKGNAQAVVAVGLDVAQMAYKATSKIPVFFCGVPYPAVYGFLMQRPNAAPFAGLNQEVPVESYCAELLKLSNTWTDAGVILPKDYLAGEKEAQSFTTAFTSKFGGTVHVISIDAKTCSQLMDVVGAYNLIASKKVSLYYAIDDGNIAKYLNMLVRQCRNQQVPVIGGGSETVELGAIMAAVPDADEVGTQAAEMILRLLNGEKCSSESVRKYKMLNNTNVLAELGISK
jgi:ABC-type uncharacterized transport system substrate-binding protein